MRQSLPLKRQGARTTFAIVFAHLAARMLSPMPGDHRTLA